MRVNYMFFLFFLISTSSFAQLVNIEGKRMQTDSIRFVLKNDFSFTYTNNDGNYLYQISNGLSTQVKSKDLKKIYFLIGNYNLIRSKDKDFQNVWFLHARFNYKITNLFRVESFIQSQQNKLMDVNSRNLIGTGIRLKLISKDYLKVYIANAYMYEIEKSDEFDQEYYNHRSSSYLSFTATVPKSKITILSTLYYQPLYKDLSDYRLMEQFKAEYKLSKYLNFFALFNYYYESVTPKDRAQFDSKLKLGLGIKL